MSAPDIGDVESIKLPDKFTLSHSGGSGFSMTAIWECPRKAALKLLGWRVKRKTFALAFGSVAHRQAFMPYTDDEPVDPVAARGVIEDAVSYEKINDTYVNTRGEVKQITMDLEVKDDERLSGPQIMEKIMEVWDDYRWSNEDVMACERLAVTDIKDPKNGNVPGICDGIRFAGRLDLAVKTDYGVAIRDLKTAKKPLGASWINDIGYTMQLSSYRYIWGALTSNAVDDIGLFQLVKNKTRAGIEKHAKELRLDKYFGWERVFNALVGTVEQLKLHEKAKQWPQCHPKQCAGMYGMPCEFAPLCFADEMGQDKWQETLHRRED